MTEVKRHDRVDIVDFELFKDGEKLDAPNLTYYKIVDFKADGSMTAKYLGEASSTLIDSHCKDIQFKDGEWIQEDSRKVTTARMVVVDRSEKKVIVVIEAEKYA